MWGIKQESRRTLRFWTEELQRENCLLNTFEERERKVRRLVLDMLSLWYY